MNMQKLLTEITDLVEAIRASDSTKPPMKIIQYESASLPLYDNNIEKFNTVTEELWKADDEVYRTTSLKTVERELVSLISNCLQTCATLTVEHIKQFFEKLRSQTKEDYTIFRVVEGASLTSRDPLMLGPFTLYDWEKHRNNLPQPDDPLLWQGLRPQESQQQGSQPRVLISVQVSARDPKRALELADEQFDCFENVIRYMIAEEIASTAGRIDVAIFDYRYQTFLRYAGISPNWRFNGAQMTGSIEEFKKDLAHLFFTDATRGHKQLWEILKKPNPTDLEKRILRAVEWCGKGVRDPDLARAFVQLIFALEALLTFKEKGVLVSPSIAYQLAEFTAFIVGNSSEEKIRLEESVKELYEKRSAIVHSGSFNVSKEEFLEAMRLLKRVITKLLIDPNLSALKSIDQLRGWVQQQKYSRHSFC